MKKNKLSQQEWKALMIGVLFFTPKDGENPEAVRAWWGKVAEVLLEQARESVPSAEFLAILHNIAMELSFGKIPDQIRDVANKDRAGPSVSEIKHIRQAVTYHQAVTKKLVPELKDPHPSRTVMEA